MAKLTRTEAVALARELATPMSPPELDERHVLEIVEIDKRDGVYVELYVGRLWSSLVKREGPGVSVLCFERIGDRWQMGTGSTTDAQSEDQADLAAALARLVEQQSHFRPKPVRPAKQALPKAGRALSEAEGAGALAATPVRGTVPRSSDADVDEAEKALQTRLPAGYRTFVVALGHGVYGALVRVYSPERVVSALGAWRARIEQYWFWGDAPLSQEHALECVCFADTMNGDELVFHPSDPDAILLLPRESERSRTLDRGLAAALAKLVRDPAPELS